MPPTGNSTAEHDDFTTVEHAATPTDAHQLCGVLQSAGLDAQVHGAHLLQAYDWLTPAAGGVPVRVPHSQLAAAREALAAYRAGSLALADDGAPETPPLEAPPGALYSPDIAAILSFVLISPAFGAGVHLLNARRLSPSGAGLLAWGWFAVLAAGTASIFVLLGLGPQAPFPPAIATLAVSVLTAIWYLSLGQAQSRSLISRFGPGYPRRSLVPLALAVAAAQTLLLMLLQALLD